MSKPMMFLPFAFLAGHQGFAMLGPYLAVCAVLSGVKHSRRRAALAAAVAG